MVPSDSRGNSAGVEFGARALHPVAQLSTVEHAGRVILMAVVELAGIVGLFLLLGGCASLEKSMDALGHDQSNACVTISTPYGTAAAIRTNRDGARCTAAGGQCSCDSVGAR